MSTLAFVPFVRDVLSVKLTPAQRVLAAVAFDGAEPRDLEGDDRDLARRLFGDVETIPAEARHVLVAVCGARAGKSYVLGALRLLHLALTVPLDTLAPGELAVALIVAPDLRLARQVLRYALGAAELAPSIRRCIGSRAADGFTLKRPDGGTVSLECLPATRGGSAVRGRSLVGAVLDECAFFRDESFQVNDAEVFRAVAPRVLRGGQVIVASTPWTEGGLLHDFHKRNHGHPLDAISAHAPTLLLRDDDHTRSYVARERARDQANASREFDAEFMAAGAEAFLDARAVDAAEDGGILLPTPRLAGAIITAGADFAFRSDSSALAIVQRADLYQLSQLVEVTPDGSPLKPSAVVKRFASELRPFEIDTLIADGHYRQSIEEHLETDGLYLQPAPEGASGKVDTYVAARSLLHEGLVKLPSHERLTRQLKAVVSRPLPGGGVSITSPRSRSGGHGDLVSALVLALWSASRQAAPEAETQRAEPGSHEWIRAREEERVQRFTDEFQAAQEDGSDSNKWIWGPQ